MITKLKTAAAAAALTAGLLAAPMVLAQQPVTGGTEGGVRGRDVSASTYGNGSTDGSSLGVGGGGEATAEDGSAGTDSRARLNHRRAMQQSTAVARTEDERARSRTRTVVRNGGEIRSRTTSMYRDREAGGPPVRETVCSRTAADGTVTDGCGGGGRNGNRNRDRDD